MQRKQSCSKKGRKWKLWEKWKNDLSIAILSSHISTGIMFNVSEQIHTSIHQGEENWNIPWLGPGTRYLQCKQWGRKGSHLWRPLNYQVKNFLGELQTQKYISLLSKGNFRVLGFPLPMCLHKIPGAYYPGKHRREANSQSLAVTIATIFLFATQYSCEMLLSTVCWALLLWMGSIDKFFTLFLF